jgi:hypothetical protein
LIPLTASGDSDKQPAKKHKVPIPAVCQNRVVVQFEEHLGSRLANRNPKRKRGKNLGPRLRFEAVIFWLVGIIAWPLAGVFAARAGWVRRFSPLGGGSILFLAF